MQNQSRRELADMDGSDAVNLMRGQREKPLSLEGKEVGFDAQSDMTVITDFLTAIPELKSCVS